MKKIAYIFLIAVLLFTSCDTFNKVYKSSDINYKYEAAKEYYAEACRRLLRVARLIIEPALMRKESRGGHYREDFPCSDEAFALHSVQQYGKEITTAPVNEGYFEF